MRRNPFDSELKLIGEEFGNVLAATVSSIDRWGLKKYHLKKHRRKALNMLEKIRDKQFQSEYAQKYQKRFNKYSSSLFTYLTHDNVPWNNNNAEHALHSFAKLRRFMDGMYTRHSLEELLIILSVLQTCEYNGINPLEFLLSGIRRLNKIIG
jgi:hypothetical protein